MSKKSHKKASKKTQGLEQRMLEADRQDSWLLSRQLATQELQTTELSNKEIGGRPKKNNQPQEEE